MLQKYKIEIKWALIFFGFTLLWSLLERLFGLHDTHIDKHPIVTNFFAIPAITIYVLALRDKKKSFYNGSITYSQAFISGVIMTVIITVLNPLTQWIISNVITPDYFKNAVDFSVDSGKTTMEEAKAFFNYKSYALLGTVWVLVMGIITSAIVSLFIRTKSK